MEMASKGLFSNFWGGSRSTQTETKTKSFTMLQRPPSRTSKDLGNYRTAIQSAERIGSPDRTLLYDIYFEQLDLDGHLAGIINKRKLNILNKTIEYFDGQGNSIDSVNDFINSPEFRNFLSDAIDTMFWGFSLFEFGGYEDGWFTYDLIPRKHVKPELGIVVKNQTDTKGVPYTSDILTRFVLPFGKTSDLGILKTAIYYSIQKRNLMGDWANYSEMAGNNFREITYTGNDVLVKNAAENALKKSGSNGVYSLPDGVEVKYINNSSTQQNQLFEGRLKVLNDEQSKLILGQTMTTDDGSSRSQAEVHERQQNDIFFADESYILNFLNFNFSDYLKYWDLPIDGTFTFTKQETISEMIEHDKKLKELGYEFTPEYLKEKYGIDD